MRPATGPPPAQDPTARGLIKAREGDVTFPYWGDNLNWHASGVRRDTLNGRHATTVFYDSVGGDRVAYTVVAVPALRIPSGHRDDKQFVVLRQRGRTVVTWREHGQTCLISMKSSPDSEQTLVWLAEQDAEA